MLRKNVNHSASEAAAGEHHAVDALHPHITPMKYYWGVLGALLFLTVVTVGVSELHLPMPYSIIIAMAVACVKASLVVSVFMHLIWDKKLNTVVFMVGVAWMLIFFSLTMVDMLSRSMVIPEQGHFYKFDETMKKGQLPPGYRVADPNAAAHGEHGEAAKDGDAGSEHGGGSH
jgi:caa(3)-type oxidase subunit IV